MTKPHGATLSSSTRKVLSSLSVFMLLSAILAGCVSKSSNTGTSNSSGNGGTQTPATIKLGIPLPLSGSNAFTGGIIKNALSLAIDEVNNKGGVRGGAKLEPLFEDTESNVQKARTVAEKLLTQQKVTLLTGQYSSAETYPTAQLAEQYKVPFVITSAAADNITQQGWKYIYRIVQPSAEFDDALKDFLSNSVKPKTMAILHENGLFGTSTSDAMRAWAAKNNVNVVVGEAYDPASTDFKPLLLKVKQKNPDVVYMVSFLLDATLLMRQAKEVDLNPQVFAGAAAGFAVQQFLDGAGANAEYVVSSTMWAPTVPYPGAKEYYDAYLKRFNSIPSYHGAMAYAGVQVIADVLNRAKSLSNDDIIAALDGTDLMTMFGKVKFQAYDKFTHQARIPTALVQVQNKQYVTISPKEIAAAQAKVPTPPWNSR